MFKPAVIAEADLVVAIAKAERYVQRDALSLPPLTSALGEIWALMICEFSCTAPSADDTRRLNGL